MVSVGACMSETCDHTISYVLLTYIKIHINIHIIYIIHCLLVQLHAGHAQLVEHPRVPTALQLLPELITTCIATAIGMASRSRSSTSRAIGYEKSQCTLEHLERQRGIARAELCGIIQSNKLGTAIRIHSYILI